MALPRMDESGVRKSWEMDASRVLRTRSVSAAARALTISRDERGAFERGGGLLRERIEQRARLGIERRVAGRMRNADHADRPPEARSGRKNHGTIGNVAVAAPAGSSCVKAQRAADMAAVSSASSGGQAALSTRSPSVLSSNTTAAG